jgi:hypothetical protein
MNRYHLLAAEMFGYSYANYEDHLGIGNVRYEKRMPGEARTLERAESENWSIEKVAKTLKVEIDEAKSTVRAFRLAKVVVDAGNAAESFRWGVRHSIEMAIEHGLRDEPSIERLVIQICYRAADLGFLLDREKKVLSHYSQDLRREPCSEQIDMPEE